MASLQILEGKSDKKTLRKPKQFFYMSQEIQALLIFQTYADRMGTFKDCRLPARLCQVWEHDCGWGQLQIPSFWRAWWNLNHWHKRWFKHCHVSIQHTSIRLRICMVLLPLADGIYMMVYKRSKRLWNMESNSSNMGTRIWCFWTLQKLLWAACDLFSKVLL